MLIRQIAVSFWGFSASFATGIILGADQGYAAYLATVISAVQSVIWVAAYYINLLRHNRVTAEERRLLSAIMQNRCPDCDKIALELTSETTLHCLDCGSAFGVKKSNGMPKRIKS